jgi:hypothetical protein
LRSDQYLLQVSTSLSLWPKRLGISTRKQNSSLVIPAKRRQFSILAGRPTQATRADHGERLIDRLDNVRLPNGLAPTSWTNPLPAREFPMFFVFSHCVAAICSSDAALGLSFSQRSCFIRISATPPKSQSLQSDYENE